MLLLRTQRDRRHWQAGLNSAGKSPRPKKRNRNVAIRRCTVYDDLCLDAHLPNSLYRARRYVGMLRPAPTTPDRFRVSNGNIRRARRRSCPRCAQMPLASTVACDLTRHIAFLVQIRVSGRARVRGACPHRRSRVSRVARALPRLRRIAADRAGAARRTGARVRARASGLSAPCNCTACASSPEAVPPLVCGTLTREPNESLDAPGLPKMPLMPARRSQLSPILHRAGRCLRTPCSVSVSSRS